MNVSRIITPIHRRLRSEQRTAPAIAGAIILSYLTLIAAALWPSGGLFAVAALIAYAAEAAAVRRASYFRKALDQVDLGPAPRVVIREAALLLLLARSAALSAGWFAAVAGGLVLAHALRAAHTHIALLVAERRRLPVLTRGFDLSRLSVPAAPPAFMRDPGMTLYLDTPVLAGALLGMAARSAWPVAAGLVVTAVTGLCAIAVAARHARLNRHLADRERFLTVVAEDVAEYTPEVVLYFSGSYDSVYQVNMWLETFDRLEHRKLIILREQENLGLLGRTASPVLCFPGGTEMMNFPMPDSTRVALFPANAGKNIHMLRLRDIRCVFIGHGDSDKAASFSPFSKVYDEVWVAGPAGRERYRRSDAGVRDEEIVEVGRPQLASIDTTGVTPDPIFTVLYAPTWEGWTGDRFHTSVAVMGPAIVRTLLDQPHVRLLYKPHPLAGNNDPAVRRAHQKIITMIEQANAVHDREGDRPADPARWAAARRRLDELTATLATLAGEGTGGRDEAEAAKAAAERDPAVDTLWRNTVAERERLYWESEGWWRHRVITGSVPELYTCFDRADLLITDISSVVADFIASGKPYVVTNGADLPAEEFQARNPTASAAYLLGRDCSALPGILAAVSADGDDPLAARRRALGHHLLGSGDAMTRFTQALDAIAAKRSRDAMEVGDPA